MARQRGYIDILLLYVWLVSLLSLIASARPWGKPFKGRLPTISWINRLCIINF